PVAELQHVGVVPVARAGNAGVAGVRVDDRLHPGPVRADVPGGTPEVAHARGPVPRLVLAPLADAVHDRAVGRGERVTHRLVPLLRVDPLVVAVVVLEVVDAPAREGLRVGLLVPEATGEAGL